MYSMCMALQLVYLTVIYWRNCPHETSPDSMVATVSVGTQDQVSVQWIDS